MDAAGDITGSSVFNDGQFDIDGGTDDTVLLVAGGNVSLDGSTALLNANSGAADNFTVNAAGNVVIDRVVAGGDLTVVAGGLPDIGSLTSGGTTSVSGTSVILADASVGGDLLLDATAGGIDATGISSVVGAIALNATGDVAFADLQAQGGDFTVTSGGMMTFGDALADGSVAFTGTSIDGQSIDAGSNIVLTSIVGDIAVAELQSGFGTTIESAAAIAFDTLSAFGPVNLTGSSITGADLQATGLNVIASGQFAVDTVSATGFETGFADITADEGILIDTLFARGGAQLTASSGNIVVSTDVFVPGTIVALGEEITLRAAGSVTVDATATAGHIDIEAGNDLAIVAASASGDAILSAGETLSVVGNDRGVGTDGSAILAAGGDLVLNGPVIAGATLALTAGGLADISASAVGQSIQLAAADLAIGPNGRLGASDVTQTIAISGPGDVIVGGDGNDENETFTLDNDEMTRVHSGGDLSIATGEGTLFVDDLTVTAGEGLSPTDGNFGRNEVFSLSGELGIEVLGALTAQNATAETGFVFTTAETLFIDAETGLVQILDADENYSGALSFTARDVYAMTRDALADIEGLSIAEVDTRLAENDGIDNADGLIRAGSLSVQLRSSSFFVQNTGIGTELKERRGITVDSLSIAPVDAGVAVDIVVNGIVAGRTGVDAIGVTQIEGDFDPASTINGCLIADPAGCVAVEPLVTFDFAIQGLIEELIAREDEIPATFSEGIESVLIEIRDPEEYGEAPLIDDPVTGAGNEDLWIAEAAE